MSLQRIILLLSILAMAALITGSVLYYRTSYNAHLESDFALAREELLRISDYVEQQVVSRQRIVAALALTTDTAEVLARPSPSTQEALNKQFQVLSQKLGVSTIYLLNAQGETVASSNAGQPDSFVGHNFGFRSYFREALAGKPNHQIALGTISKVVGTYYGHPVPGTSGARGVLVVRSAGADAAQGVLVVKARLDLPQLELADATFKSPGAIPPSSITLVANFDGAVYAANHGGWKESRLPMAAMAGQDYRQVEIQSSLYNVVSLPLRDFPGWHLVRLSKLPHWLAPLLEPLAAPTGLLYLSLLGAFAAWMFVLHRAATRHMRHQALTTLRLRRSQLLYRELSTTDTLTGLYNRRRYYTDITCEMQRSERYGRPASMALIDLDFFKKINDEHGHCEGDQVLRLFADMLKRHLRSSDTAYRIGGEEFLLILPETPPAEARAIICRIRTALREEPYHVPDGARLTIKFSCGIAAYSSGESEHEFFGRTDKLLYQAKEEGRDKVLVAT